MTINDGGPAFPVPGMQYPSGDVEYREFGISKRDYFAAAALQGLMALLAGVDVKFPAPDILASDAFMQADLMLKAGEVGNGEWISVKDRLPEQGSLPRSKSVLIYCPDIKCIFAALYSFEWSRWEYFGVSDTVRHSVSHWMPLPSPPESP